MVSVAASRVDVLDVSREPEFTPHFALTERDRVHLVYETRVGIDDGACRPAPRRSGRGHPPPAGERAG
jgi:hypothetical protein